MPIPKSKARDRQTIFRFGSDDGIKVWVNGQLVHANEVGRAYKPNADRAPASLKAGLNRILIKIDNYTGDWGFGMAVPGVEEKASKE